MTGGSASRTSTANPARPSRQREKLVTLGCGLFVASSALVYWAAAAADGARGTLYLVAHFAFTVGAIVIWLLARRLGSSAARWIIWAGIVTRLLLIPVTHFTTHDPDRYLWDGAVAADGFDPYITAPEDAAVAHLRTEWPTPAEHRQYATLYPPAALALFSACTVLGPTAGPWAWKLAVTLASLAILLWVAQQMYRRGDLRNVAWVALNPLLILEGGVGAHVDLFAALGLVGAVLLVGRLLPVGAGISLGAGILFKLTPVVALPPLIVLLLTAGNYRGKRWPALAKLVGATLATVGGGYGLAIAIGMKPVGVIGQFVALWRFGSPLVAGLGALLGPWLLPAAAVAGIVAIAAVALRTTLLVGSLHRRAAWAAAAALMALFVCSPVVFPWYLVPIAALLVLAPSWTGGIWITTLPLTYEVIDGFDRAGTWQPAGWPLFVVVAGWLVGLGLDRLVPLERSPVTDRRPGHR